MTSIQLNSITGLNYPYDVYVCDVYGNNCGFISTISTSVPTPVEIVLPIPFNYAPAVGIKIITSDGCEKFIVYDCIYITPTQTPTITPTPTHTPTIVFNTCDVVINDGGDVYYYNPITNTTQLILSTSVYYCPDVAMTNDRLWLYDNSYIYEYNLTLTPFSISQTPDRIISYSAPFGAGLCARDNNFLIMGDTQLVRLNITTTAATTVLIFNLPPGLSVEGDVLYNSVTNRYFVTYTDGVNSYIGEFRSNGVIWNSNILPFTQAYGLYMIGTSLYVTKVTGEVYSIDLVTLAATYVQTITGPFAVYGAAQPPSCITGGFTQTPTPTQTPTITPTISVTPSITPTATYPYVFDPYVYLIPEPQDTTSLTNLGNYMYNSGSTSFLGWGNGGVPSTGSYSNDLNIYIHYSGFTGGSGNFITNVSTLKGYIKQTTGTTLDTFGCSQDQYTFNTIELQTSQVNTGIQYFYTLWIPLNAVGGTMSNMTVDIGTNTPCSNDIAYNAIPDSVLSSVDVVVTSGAAIPSNVYRVLWIDPTCLLPIALPPPALSSSIFFKGNTKT